MGQGLKKFVGLSVLIIILVSVVNDVYTHQNKLDDVVFLDHYIDFQSDMNGQRFSLQYITNVDDDRQVIDLFFEHQFHMRVLGQDHQVYGPYKMVTVHFECPRFYAKEDLTFDEVDVLWKDGHGQVYPIGQVRYLKSPETLPFTMQGVSSGYDHVTLTYETVQALSIKGFQVSAAVAKNFEFGLAADDQGPLFEGKLTHVDDLKLPLAVEKNLSFFIKQTGDEMTVYRSLGRLTTDAGDLFINNIINHPIYTLDDIKTFLKKRGQ